MFLIGNLLVISLISIINASSYIYKKAELKCHYL